MFLSATPSRQGACREESLVTVTEWTDGEIDKHKGMWHSLRPKESKSWASPSPHCGEMRRFWKGCGIHVSKQTLPQIASVISPSPPDIQTEARKRRTGSPSNGIHWQGWSLWPTLDIWGSLCFAEHVCYWTSVCPSHPLSTSLPFPSSISFSSLISFYPFFFLKEDFAFKKIPIFSQLRQRRRKRNLPVYDPPELTGKMRETFEAGEVLLVVDAAWNRGKGWGWMGEMSSEGKSQE